MALDPSIIADGFVKSGGWYAAGLLVVVVVPLFWLYDRAQEKLIKVQTDRADRAESALVVERAKRDDQHDKLLLTADRVIQVQAALEKRLPRPRAEKEGA